MLCGGHVCKTATERQRADLVFNFASPKHLVQNIYLYAHWDGRTFTIYIQRDKQDHTHDTCTCSLMFYKIKTALLTYQMLVSNEPLHLSLLLRTRKPIFVNIMKCQIKFSHRIF